MHLQDFDGRCQLETEEDLTNRLRTIRKGNFGAFILWHEDGGPSLWVHLNKDLAHLHFFPDASGAHPGFQCSTGLASGGEVRFLQTDGSEADSITVPRDAVIPVQHAYEAAREFLHTKTRPSSIQWLEL